MDKGLTTLFTVVGIALVVFILIVLWIFWQDIAAEYRWHEVKKAHKLPKDNLNTGKSSMLGSRSKSKNS